jgi:hypothetical protein
MRLSDRIRADNRAAGYMDARDAELKAMHEAASAKRAAAASRKERIGAARGPALPLGADTGKGGAA